MPRKKTGDTQSTTSSKSFKSLASKASSTLKKVKRKASTALSTLRRKKAKHIPKGDDSDNSCSATDDPDVDLARKRPPSVVEIDDDSDADSKSDTSNDVENSDDELRKQP
jgi:hypothetical protein